MTPEEIKLFGLPLYRKSKTTSTHRRCNMCGQWKKYSEFHKDKNRDPKITHSCKTCDAERRTKKRRQKYSKIEKKYGPLVSSSRGTVTGTHKKCPECKKWKKHSSFGVSVANLLNLCTYCKECVHGIDLQKRYGISVEVYSQLLASQGGGCAICGALAAHSNTEKLFVDHNHETGKVRGLLCHCCNAMLGYAKDNTSNLCKGIQYLERTK
jgi:hypothetical protein